MIGDADSLEEEKNREHFFAAYSPINNSLEQMFIDLLLLIDGWKSRVKPAERVLFDLSEVEDAIKAVTLKGLDGK